MSVEQIFLIKQNNQLITYGDIIGPIMWLVLEVLFSIHFFLQHGNLLWHCFCFLNVYNKQTNKKRKPHSHKILKLSVDLYVEYVVYSHAAKSVHHAWTAFNLRTFPGPAGNLTKPLEIKCDFSLNKHGGRKRKALVKGVETAWAWIILVT